MKKTSLLLVLVAGICYGADEAFKATLNVVSEMFTANQSLRIERLVADGIPVSDAIEFVKGSAEGMRNIAQLVGSGMPLQVAQDVASKVPEAVKYMVKDHPKVGLGLVGAGAAGYMGYKCIKDRCSLDFIVNSKNKLMGIFVTPESIQEVAQRNGILTDDEFVELIPKMPDPRGIPTERLRLFATTEEMSNNGSSYWREEYGKRMRQEEDADRKLAIEQGTLDSE